jgi:hypothetical protein
MARDQASKFEFAWLCEPPGLEHKFESHAAMLREEYLAVILQIPESLEK